jgi:hypothetical protein
MLASLPGDTTISTRDYVDIRTADEFARVPEPIGDVTLQSTSGDDHIVITLEGKPRVKISSRDNNDLLAVFSRVQTLLDNRRRLIPRPSFRSLSDFLAIPAALALVSSLTVIFVGPENVRQSAPLVWIFAAVLLPFAVYLLAAITGEESSVIVPRYRSEAPTFWERHNAAIVISLATNIVVAAIFFLLGRSMPPT